MQLNNEQRKLVEENMGLVGEVIKACVRGIGQMTAFTYDDLFQIGSFGLCKAALSSKPHEAKFSTFAYVCIRNEIYDELAKATKRAGRELATDPFELQSSTEADEFNDDSISDALLKLEMQSTGVTAKGCKALRLIADGYTNREVGEMMGVSANNVTAWVARVRRAIATSQICKTETIP